MHRSSRRDRGAAPLGAFGGFVTVLWIVGFMNAYNFMDGVNGIAAATILGDGHVALIADVAALVRRTEAAAVVA